MSLGTQAGPDASDDLMHWVGNLAAPVAWFVQLCVVYALAPLTCSLDNPLLMHLASLLCLGMAVAGLVISYLGWESAGRGVATDTREGHMARVRFQSLVGLAVGSLFSLVILAEWLAATVLKPCVP